MTLRGGDTSMAGMAIAIPGVLHILKTGDKIGKIRLHRGKKREKMAKKPNKWAEKTGVCILAIPAKVGQCRPCVGLSSRGDMGHRTGEGGELEDCKLATFVPGIVLQCISFY